MANRNEHRRKLRQALSDRGQRFTRQRARVFDVLASTDQHPTAEEVYIRVKQTMPSVSLATIYKALDALVNCGLAQKLTYGDGSARYDANAEEHPHMRDLLTGRVLDVPPELAAQIACNLPAPLAMEIARQTGFKVAGLRIELLGQVDSTMDGQPPVS